MKKVFLVAAIAVVGGAGFAINYLKPSQSEASELPPRMSELRERIPAERGDQFVVKTVDEETVMSEHDSQ